MAQGSLLPREHGAYGQVVFPLAAAFGVSGLSPGGLLLSAAVIAGFLAHEPAAIVLGQRGVRAARDYGARAARWLWSYVAIGLAAALTAAVIIPPDARWSLVVPAVPALLLGVALIAGREKSWQGETAAALAFSGAAVPVTLAAGAPMDAAWRVAVPFALLFTTTTLAVRVVILRTRGGGNPRITAATQRAAIALSLGALTAIAAFVATEQLPPSVLLASAPGALTTTIVAARPPAARRLRTLGWSLVAVSTLTAVIVVATV